MGDASTVQTVGLWGVVGTAFTAIGLIIKGAYQFLKDVVKTRNDTADAKSSRSATLVEVSSAAAVTMLGKLSEDNDRFRLRAEKAEEKVDAVEVENATLRVEVEKLTAKVAMQGVQITDLLVRITGLEHS